MTVAELIAALQAHHPDSIVILGEFVEEKAKPLSVDGMPAAYVDDAHAEVIYEEDGAILHEGYEDAHYDEYVFIIPERK